MSRGHAPKTAPRVIGPETAAPQEEHVETELRAPVAAQPAQDAVSRPIGSPASGQPELERVDRVIVQNADHQEPAASPVTRETREHQTRVEHRTVVEPASSDRPPRERVAIPAAAQWLEEDRSAADPLVATAENDALRELMQRVRHWTSSAPTVIEPAAANTPAATASPVMPVAPAPEPSHVSIGNVTITVEDAPVARARGERAPSAARSASDRMARHHIRGG